MCDNHKTISDQIQDCVPNDFFDLIPGSLFVINLNGRIVDCNEGACEMFGYSKNEMLYLRSKDLLPGDRNYTPPNIFTDSVDSYIWLSCLKKNGHIFPVLYKNRIVVVNGQRFALFNVVDKFEINLGSQKNKECKNCLEEIPHSLCMSWEKKGDDYLLVGYDKVTELYTSGKISGFIGKKARDLYQNQSDILSNFDLCMQKKNVLRFESPYCMFSTGENKYMIITYVFVQPNLVITFCDDITKRKKIENLLRESEKRRLLALEAASEGVWEWNIPSGTIITCAAYFSMLGFGPDDLPLSNPEIITSYDEFLDLVHKDDRNDVDKRLRHCISCKERTCETELRLRTKTGSWKWILKRGRVVDWDPDGNPVRMIGTHIDIDESRRAKDALKQNEERLRAQYMGHPLPTYTWQRMGNEIILVDYNTAAYKFTNGHIAEFIGRKARILYKKNQEIFDTIINTYDDRTIYKGETLYRMFSTEDEKYVTFTCAYVAPDMVLVYMEDITKQRSVEKKLQRSKKDLQKLTAQLITAEENVRQSIAQELHDSIGQYLSSIKYVAEKSVAQIHAEHPDSEESSLNTLVPIIQTAIDEVSRISMDLRPSTLDDLGIIATVSWFCREYQAVYPSLELAKNIEIEESDVPSPIKINLFRILQESLNNVGRHSRATCVRIGLLKTENRIEIFITDNGIGFNVQEKIHIGLNGRRGFGLFSMQERTKHSGGMFSITSIPKKGTTIRASWPGK
ncbi:MAG: PAS domain S-box protein [Desulfobacterales bacterium]|nr:PAS domain S-box protein [Desulfobacterales bacterium]MDD4073360.1 PAS domain S-box protein [Desulfobacterales bacterium]MDD4394113.1 PAS domain S-box protein [Desulfobacterales bacterium]